jgi:hypothetical protein
MGDSFFTTRNQVDDQIIGATPAFCEELIEASARRIVKLSGPMEAAVRLQRIADICAGAYVLPIEHWRELGRREQQEPTIAEMYAKARAETGVQEPTAPEPPSAPWRQRIAAAIAASPFSFYFLGMFVGFVIGWTF